MSSRHLLMSTALIGTGLLCFAPSNARADHDRDHTRVETTDPYAPVTREDDSDHVRSRIGVAVSIGGGVGNFTDHNLNNQTDPGGNWQARLTVGTRSFVALEGAYLGQANNISGLGLDPDTLLTANGMEGLLRLNLSRSAIQPYVFGGAAWKRYSLLYNNNTTSSVRTNDNVVEAPFGGGVAFRAASFVFDTRFSYRPAFDEDMFASIGGKDVTMNNWDATARLGFEF